MATEEGSPLAKCGQLELDGTAQAISETGKCRGVWVQHDGDNSHEILIGDVYQQLMSLPITSTTGYYLRVNSPTVLRFKGTAGEKMNYLVWR